MNKEGQEMVADLIERIKDLEEENEKLKEENEELKEPNGLELACDRDWETISCPSLFIYN